MLQQSIKSGLQTGLGALGKHVPGLAGKPDFTTSNPGHVIVDNFNVSAASPGSSGNGGGLFGGGSLGGGAFSLLKSLLGHGGGTDVSSSVSYPGAGDAAESLGSWFGGGLASGGDMDPGKIYNLAEGGEGEWVMPKRSSTVTPASKMGGDTHYHAYKVDARGAEIGVEHRVAQAIAMAHDEAVKNSIRATHERSTRTPKRSRD
jgi:hypothetical protein